METIPSLQLSCRSFFSIRMMRRCLPSLALAAAAALPALATAQMTSYTAATLDPTRTEAALHLERTAHQPLPEQYIWVADKQAGHSGSSPKAHVYFKRSFTLDSVPLAATLYVAGPGTLKVFVNGLLAGTDSVEPNTNLGIRTMSFNVAHLLKAGSNTIALDATDGPHKGFGSDDPAALALEQGRVLVVKLLPAILGENAKPLLLSDASWKASDDDPQNWQQPGFNDTLWSKVVTYGGIESDIDFFQANSDSGLYDWPGYNGISPFLAQYTLAPAKVEQAADGIGTVTGADSLTGSGAADLSVTLPTESALLPKGPQVLLDFGREVVGRIRIASASDQPSDVVIQYGESKDEALQGPYLGQDPIHLAPRATAYGPKSAFRYVLVRFVRGEHQQYSALNLDGIAYPVKWQGSFESSDPMLNKAWAVGAYTAHLCMQDDIWDAPKRDRARWMGDLDVSGRTINDAFGDTFLMEQTLDALLGPHPATQDVNTIPGYSAFWFTGEAQFYRTHDAKAQLEALHPRMVQLLHRMASELNGNGLFVNAQHGWPFVDWSPELHDDTPLARMGTQMEFYAAFHQAAYLLNQLGDSKEAQFATNTADAIGQAAQEHLLDASGSYSDRWQPNAYAVLSGVATPSQYPSIWKNALSSVGHVKYNALIITPYYNYYVISAMAKMDHRQAALDWIRQYWGGMLAEGATSFWEGYMPDWYKDPFHQSLQADQQSGFVVSLAHGWSTGITPWLTEQVLGVQSTGPGFSTVRIRPDLIDLSYAKGTVPTPRGLLAVSIKKEGAAGMSVSIDLPENTKATVLMPAGSGAHITLNGKAANATPVAPGNRSAVLLQSGGHYELESR
jgi:alpha-L-rhamnosidase